jgi:hypothetical protein
MNRLSAAAVRKTNLEARKPRKELETMQLSWIPGFQFSLRKSADNN